MKPLVLVVGAGSIGERHIRCFQSTGRTEIAFVEIQSTLRGEIARRYAISGFEDLEQAIAQISKDEDVTRMAIVATPANTHIAIALKLAQHGFHLLIEKPLSVHLEGIDSLIEESAQKNLIIGVAYVYRCFAGLIAMRDALRSGRFGKPVQIVAVSGQNFPTYRPAYRSTYYTDRATGGGAIQDALTHVLNAGEWLVGPIDRLVADAAHQILDGVNVEDTAHILTRHGNVLGSYSLNQYQSPNESTITVVCTEGTVRWESHTQSWRWMIQPDQPWHEEPQFVQPRDAAFIFQANRFLDAVEDRAQPPCTLTEGVQTLKVNLAALKSLHSHQWEEIDE
jgi:predicted dehydrogenase